MTRLTRLLSTASAFLLGTTAMPAIANGPLPGETGAFEQAYLMFILDHHYLGLRATELAAGTAAVGLTVPPGPWPANPASFRPTPAKATDPVALDVAVRSNATQENEINIGENFLLDWYGYTTELNIPSAGQALLDRLDAAAPGDPFNIAFLDGFSDHHVEAINRSAECINRAGHEALRHYCMNIVTAQAKDIDEMRDELANRYGIFGDPSAVPEPKSWAMLILGFGAIGAITRGRQRCAMVAN